MAMRGVCDSVGNAVLTGVKRSYALCVFGVAMVSLLRSLG